METEVEIGLNRTGTGLSPKLTADMLEGTKEFPPNAAGDERAIASVREEYARVGDRVGSVPPPMSVGGITKAMVEGIRGTRPAQFIDKLGERLAFERMGVRLYESLLSKYDVFGSFEDGPSRDDLQQMLLQEHSHFRLLVEAVIKVGGDPTVMTPAADVAATLSRGVMDVLVDPRTTFAQSLEAILVAELVDNEAWDGLIELAEQRNDAELVSQFRAALADEVVHLERVRSWIAASQRRAEPA